jgi:hypothetical protein
MAHLLFVIISFFGLSDQPTNDNDNFFVFFLENSQNNHNRLMDLQPGTDYWIRVSALVNEMKVKDAPLVEFRTDACRPDTPLMPKLQNRTRNSLVVRWTSPSDNGSTIVHYILECDDGTGNDQYSEVYRNRNKQFTISKLQSSTCYAIRLAACNEIGASEWSPVLRATTMGAPPPPPSPPTLRSASAKQLNLIWGGGPSSLSDMVYTLQMADPDSGHGFLNVYVGSDNEYTCTGLTRSTAYRFRVSSSCERLNMMSSFEVGERELRF